MEVAPIAPADPLAGLMGSNTVQDPQTQVDSNAYTNPFSHPFPPISTDGMNLDYMPDLSDYFQGPSQNLDRMSNPPFLPKLETSLSPTSGPTTIDSIISPWDTYNDPNSTTTSISSPLEATSALPSTSKRGRKPKQPTLAPSQAKGSAAAVGAAGGSAGASATTARRRRRRRGGDEANPPSPGAQDKRSKFLERNRIAAAKCRQKKKVWAEELESRARELQASKNSLRALTASLREEVLYLKGEMVRHGRCDDQEVRGYMRGALGDIARERRSRDVESQRASVGSGSDGSGGFDGTSLLSWDGREEIDDLKDGEGELDERWGSDDEDQKLERLLMHELVRNEHGGQVKMEEE